MTILLSSCGEKKWEYKTVQVDGKEEFEFLDKFSSKDIYPTGKLNSMGEEGWELVEAYPITETVFPNFGDEKYVTGLQPNVRTKAVQYVFKREKKEKKEKK